ncbi:MAG: hypothetical protein L3J75_17390 [Methylococcaceae bacterium]|nr:hypothetical protein [Methylococcaceae bacterium]
MQSKKSNFLAAIVVTFICFILNGALFIYFYNQLATPFIKEEQRVANADYIMSVTAGGYVSTSLLIGVVVYFILNTRN